MGAICGWGVEGDGELKRRGRTLDNSRVSTSGNTVALSMEMRSPREVADERRMASSLLLEGSQEDRPNCQATVLARWETGGTGELDYL